MWPDSSWMVTSHRKKTPQLREKQHLLVIHWLVSSSLCCFCPQLPVDINLLSGNPFMPFWLWGFCSPVRNVHRLCEERGHVCSSPTSNLTSLPCASGPEGCFKKVACWPELNEPNKFISWLWNRPETSSIKAADINYYSNLVFYRLVHWVIG